GITSTAALGSLSRAHGTKALATELGDFRAAQAHHVAVARSNLLNQLLLNVRVQAQNNAGGSTLTALTTSPLSSFQETSCGCEECATTVSPNAYLADLLRYTYYRVGSGGSSPPSFDAGSVQEAFRQPFGDLPLDCDAMKTPVLRSRIAIEVLRSYADTRPALDPTPAATLASAEATYRQRVYSALLAEIGTNYDELLLAQGDNDKLTALAGLLGLPSKIEVEKLLLNDTELANEDRLESRFGVRKSTRLATEVITTDPEFLTWRLSYLASSWLVQDTPSAFPSGVPILDPDVLAYSNLRYGWDAMHTTSSLWLARRTAIDAQLTSLATARAMKVGLGAMSIAQTGRVPTATTDEKWAAYLTVNLSEEEVASAAAMLPLAQQDLARSEAAKKKAVAGRLLRSPLTGSTVTTDEQNTIDAILNYVGTALSPKVQDESKDWMKLQFTGLTPSSGSALTESAWSTNHSVLKGTSTASTVDAATQDIARFSFSVEVFLRAWDLYLKVQNQGYRAMSSADWQEFDRLFTARWKATQLATWASQEASAMIPVTVTPALFWVSPDQPAQPRWLGSVERYNQWLSALGSASADPIIDPTLIRETAFTDISTLFPPHALWITRDTWRTDTVAALQVRKGQVLAAATKTARVAEFDDKLLNYGLQIPKVDSSAQAWYEPGQLQLAYNNGSMTAAHLGQLLLSRQQFDYIFLVRKLLAADKTVSASTWQAALDALLLAMKKRLHGTWHSEEVAAGISISPDIFQLPAPLPLHFPPRFSEDNDPATPLRTAVELARFRTVLRSRIAEREALRQAIADMIDRVEQDNLPLLRDALIVAWTPADADSLNRADWLTDRLLMDFADAPDAKTSRVAHAITTLQTLIFSLRSGELFRLRTTATAALYPVLTFDAEHFDTEWRWMGSYGSWRSALFIFMYPENLLYPTLRNREEQSEPFRNLVQALREGGPVTPERVVQLAQVYDNYFADLINLEVECACHVLVPPPRIALDTTPNLQSRELLLTFAKPYGAGQAYWIYRDSELSADAFQSPWNPIPGMAKVSRILGAVPYRTKAGRRLVTIFAISLDLNGTARLQARNLDVAQLADGAWQWVGDLVDLSSVPYDPLTTGDPQFAIEQISIANTNFDPSIVSIRPYVIIGVRKTGTAMAVYRRGLNDDASGWQSGSWDNFLIPNDFECTKIHYAYNTYQAENLSVAGFTFLGHHPSDPDSDFRFYGTVGLHGGLSFAIFNPGTLLGVRVLGQVPQGVNQQVLIACTNVAILLEQFYVIFGLPPTVFPVNNFTFSIINDAPDGILGSQVAWPPFSTEALTPYDNPSFVQTFPLVAKSVAGLGYRSGLQQAVLDGAGGTLSVIPIVKLTLKAIRNGDDFLPRRPDEDTYFQAIRNRLNWTDNSDALYLLNQLYEIHFSVPMHLALQLQQAGYFQYSLDYLRLIYDYKQRDLVLDPTWGETRKVYYGLVAEEDISSEGQYSRGLRWLEDPFDPHRVAATRQNSFTQFTLLTIVRCLLDYADSEFAADTPESLPRARTLYLDAAHLLEHPDLPHPQDCEDWVATIDFSYVPTEWQPAVQGLQLAMLAAAPDLGTSGSESLQSTVTAALKDPAITSWASRFAKAHQAIKLARAARPKPAKAKDLAANARSLQAQANLALQSLPQARALTRAVVRGAAGRFRAAISTLTGVPSSALDGQPSVKLPWLSQRTSMRFKVLDSAQRFPVLAQPESVISGSYKRQNRWEPLATAGEGQSAQTLAASPALALAESDLSAAQYLPSTVVSFCVPINPVLRTLRLRAELNLYKVRTGRNITGEQRQLDFFAASTDAQTGLPGLSANGGLALPGSARLSPTEYRYPLLAERARRQVQLAAQFESQLLASLEKIDNERRNLLEARNNLAVQRATLSLKNLEVQEANLGVELIDKQQERISAVTGYLDQLIAEDVSDLEKAALAFMVGSAALHIAAVGFSIAAAAANWSGAPSALAAAATSSAAVLSAGASIFQQLAAQKRRKEEWQQQKTLAGIDSQINKIQRTQATTRVQIKEQETRIVQLNIDNAESVVDFLVTKFTNQELYEWMSRVLQGLYAAQLQQATATARLAQQ
ncbi:MAG TPA: hypothetical protein PKI03_09530, partial [Pseudomonadota bacterium]|nr:hypothetical protein [Pseudomonadota bacterium]